MLKTATSAIALSVVFLASQASAADVFGRSSTKDAPGVFDAPKVSWTGLYIGGAIGYGNANHDLSVNDYFKDYCSRRAGEEGFDAFGRGRRWTLENKNEIFNEGDDWTNCDQVTTLGGGYETVPGDSTEVSSLDGLNSTGIVGDIRLGYDQQVNRFVVGVFGTYGLSSMEAEGTNALFGDSFTLERGDDWSIGARAGLLVNDSTLLYILAAYTQTEYDLRITSGAASSSKTTTFDGVTVGGGVEFALASNVFLGIEGTHTFYGSETIFDTYDPATNVGTSVEDDLGETKVMGTLKIKLNTGLFGN
jgi:opacity protein-like surface antigen